MASYIVMEPAKAASDKAEEAVIVRDGFSAVALIMPLIWFLWYRMWVEALAFVGIVLALGGLGTLVGHPTLASILIVLLYVLTGLEAQALRIAALRRRGWTEWGVVEGSNRGEAELRFAAAANHVAQQRPSAAPPPVPAAHRPVAAAAKASGPAFGLIDYPRKI